MLNQHLKEYASLKQGTTWLFRRKILLYFSCSFVLRMIFSMFKYKATLFLSYSGVASSFGEAFRRSPSIPNPPLTTPLDLTPLFDFLTRTLNAIVLKESLPLNPVPA